MFIALLGYRNWFHKADDIIPTNLAAKVKKAWPEHRSRYPGGENMAVGDCEMQLRDLAGLVLVPSPEYCQ